MKLCSYIVKIDYGFAPNPFYGFCTLATCKYRIRKSAKIGDWVIGTGSKTNQRDGYLVYVMRVTETMTLDEYWKDPRFRNKRPEMHANDKKALFGDNIYHKDPDSNEWCQMDTYHSHCDRTPHDLYICDDTEVDRVLISDDFIYWGGTGPKLPMFCGVNLCWDRWGHKCNFPEEAVAELIAWVRSLKDRGLCGDPLDWSTHTQCLP